jgi:hypothetical protein
VELRDGTLWDGATRFAALEPSPTAVGASVLRLAGPTLVTRDVARATIEALTAARLPRLDVGDELLRAEARRVGWTGALRGPLALPLRPAVTEDPLTLLRELLPGVELQRTGLGRALSLRLATDDGIHLRVKAPLRDDLVPELVARALDVALGVRRRFGRIASGIRRITIDDGAGMFDNHRTLGSAQSGTGTFFLDTSLAFADAISAQRVRMAGRTGVSADVPRPWTTVDGVVAHEYWHNLDAQTAEVYVAIDRALGAELGVETFAHALRGRDRSAPPEWQRAFRRVVQEVSPYATTNHMEATAELFKLWWCAPPDGAVAPLVACFGAQLERFYPPPG